MKEMTFEELIYKIKSIVKQIEKENISIDESIKLFEEGTQLTSLAGTKLKDIKHRVIKIVKENESLNDFIIKKNGK